MSARAAILSDKQLGDVLLLEPSVRHLAAATGGPCALFVREAFRPLVDLMPQAVWGPEAGRRYDELWVTSWSSRAAFQALRLRATRRHLIANKPRHLRWWYRFIYHDLRLEPPAAEYWARYFWRVVSGQPAEAFQPPALRPPPAEWRHPQLPAGPFVLINPTAAWERKFWTVGQWAEVIRALACDPGLPVVIAGGGSERERAHCAAMADQCGVPTLNLAGQTSLREYLHLLAAARLVVCIDGAASHLAQAFGVPAVTLFGPTHELKWHWPTPQHAALAARHFSEPAVLGPVQAVPVPAVLAAVRQVTAAQG